MDVKEDLPAEAAEDYRPTEAEFLGGLVSGSASIRERSAAVAISLRVPMREHCTLKVLAQRSGNSLNTIVVHVIRAGLEALDGELPDADREAIRRESNILQWKVRQQAGACATYESSEKGEAA